MVVSAGRTAENHAVRVESSGGDGTGAVLLQEARIGLHAGEFVAVKVEDLDYVV